MIHSFLHHFDYTYKIKVLLGIRYQGWLPVLKRSPFLSALWLYKVNSKFSCVFIGVLKTKSEFNYIFNLFTFVIKTKFIDFSYSPFLNPSIFLPYKSLISFFFSPSFFGLNELYILCNLKGTFLHVSPICSASCDTSSLWVYTYGSLMLLFTFV